MPEELNSTASIVTDQVPVQVPEQVSDPAPGPVFDKVFEPVSEKVSEPLSDKVSEPVAQKVEEPLSDEVSDKVCDKVSDEAPEKVAVCEAVSVKENNANERPFRVKLRGSVLVLLRLPNKRSVRAAIHQLSTTGGVIHLEKPLDEKLEVEVIFHIREATIRGKAQMLFPMWATQGWMQPFRFVGLSDASRESLDANLKSFIGEAGKSTAVGA